MNTNPSIPQPNLPDIKLITNRQHKHMSSVIHESLPSDSLKLPYPISNGDVISIFGFGQQKRSNFARKLTQSLGIAKAATIDLSKVNNPDFIPYLEAKKRKFEAKACPARKKMEERLKVAMNAEEWFDDPLQTLNLEERAKMLLILELSEQPEAVIINRPTVIRQFNRKLRALRQVFRKTCVMSDTIWSYPLHIASNHVYEVGRGEPKETFVSY